MKSLAKQYYHFSGQFSSQVASGFSLRKHGNMSTFYGETAGVIENRKNFLNSLTIDYKDLVCAKQVHGNNIKVVTDKDIGRGALYYAGSIADTDGLITEYKYIPLAILTADCLSIFICDPRRPAIGLIHAGWRSTKERIAVNAVRLMQDKFNSNPGELFVGFGPCIRSCCYEVSVEFKEYFPQGADERSGFIYMDLPKENTMQLMGAGVPKENIFDPGFCTLCENNDFFSFRKEGKDCGRIISVVMLK